MRPTIKFCGKGRKHYAVSFLFFFTFLAKQALKEVETGLQQIRLSDLKKSSTCSMHISLEFNDGI